MRRYLSFSFAVLFLFSLIALNATCVSAASASSYCVIDALTGRALYEKDAHIKRGMASTTKIMTAIVALENADSSSLATVSYKASRTEGSSLYLKAGEKMSVLDLVYGLMLNSGNDAAVVLAEHIGGSVEGFSKLMNETAQKIGAKSTHFVNPNGLYDEQHYTTAYDLALITRYAMKNEKFKKIASTKKYTIQTVGNERKIYLSNHNKLLNTLDGCDGVKTGFTKKTGRCLVSSVTRNGWQAICVTLNAPDDWNDHSALMNKAFEEYNMQKIISKGQFIKTLPVSGATKDCVGVAAADDIYVPAKKNERFDFDIVYHIEENLKAPVAENQSVGSIELALDKKTFASVGVVTVEEAEMTKTVSFFDNFILILKYFIQ